jgi:DNA-binding MarR family transcriptional regulator
VLDQVAEIPIRAGRFGRPDLAAMVAPLNRALLAMEAPILAAHNVSMWAYVVLSRLSDEPRRGQAALAHEIGADKTRLIDVLDDLQQRGLIRRDPDPADRRARLLSLTAHGRRLRERVRRAIRAEEDRVLAILPAAERAAFLRAVGRLAKAAAES